MLNYANNLPSVLTMIHIGKKKCPVKQQTEKKTPFRLEDRKNQAFVEEIVPQVTFSAMYYYSQKTEGGSSNVHSVFNH